MNAWPYLLRWRKTTSVLNPFAIAFCLIKCYHLGALTVQGKKPLCSLCTFVHSHNAKIMLPPGVLQNLTCLHIWRRQKRLTLKTGRRRERETRSRGRSFPHLSITEMSIPQIKLDVWHLSIRRLDLKNESLWARITGKTNIWQWQYNWKIKLWFTNIVMQSIVSDYHLWV